MRSRSFRESSIGLTLPHPPGNYVELLGSHHPILRISLLGTWPSHRTNPLEFPGQGRPRPRIELWTHILFDIYPAARTPGLYKISSERPRPLFHFISLHLRGSLHIRQTRIHYAKGGRSWPHIYSHHFLGPPFS